MHMRKRGDIDFSAIVANKKFPILTLNSRWHELFPDEKKTFVIKEKEQQLNNLLKKQGKLNNDIKESKKLKKVFISDIISNMDTQDEKKSKFYDKRLKKNRDYINELNKKIEEASEELENIPDKIQKANEELLLESIKYCYKKFHNNQKELAEISQWILDTREELKEKILKKHDIETANKAIYSNMHDILGPEIIDIFDSIQDSSVGE